MQIYGIKYNSATIVAEIKSLLRRYLLFLLPLLIWGCGGASGDQGTPTKNFANLDASGIEWEGYANQRENLFDTYHAVKKCLLDSGMEIQQDLYPYVFIVKYLIVYDGSGTFGLCRWNPNVIYFCAPWAYSHELVHIFMHWDNSYHSESVFQTCGMIEFGIIHLTETEGEKSG